MTLRFTPGKRLKSLIAAVAVSVPAVFLFVACGGGGDDPAPAAAAPAAPAAPTDTPVVEGKVYPQQIDLTWFSVANWLFQMDGLNIVMDGYMTRIPQSSFSGGPGGLERTSSAFAIDTAAVDKIHQLFLDKLTAGKKINYLLTGHSHFDHSFDTPYWAKLTGATIIGSKTTCYQAMALGVPEKQCIPVYGGEKFQLSENVTMRVVLWNHSGTHASAGIQHDATELSAPPVPDANGRLKGGTGEDFVNGGGNRAFLFTVKTGENTRPLQFFALNSSEPTELETDTIVGGVNYGSPMQSLRNAMADGGITDVDLWLGAGGESAARIVVPQAKPKYHIVNHVGSFYSAFNTGYGYAAQSSNFKRYLQSTGVELVELFQYLDSYTLDATGVRVKPSQDLRKAYNNFQN
jgi:hypothetical protein